MPNAEWWRAYRDLSGEAEPGAKRGSFSAVIAAYKESPEWLELSNRTRSERERHLTIIESAWGELLVAGLEARHVLQLRDRYASTPGEANKVDPCDGLPPPLAFKSKSSGQTLTVALVDESGKAVKPSDVETVIADRTLLEEK